MIDEAGLRNGGHVREKGRLKAAPRREGGLKTALYEPWAA